tara:strand:- start:66 stop:1367 length:1302 start_codon:yes stop_codon:yes gene_type:complete
MGFGGGNGFSPSRTIVEDSTKTGNDASQKHQFTGSVEISGGPLKLNGASITAGGGGTPGGSDTQIQYNNGGAFGGASGLIYDDVNNRVGIGVADPDSKIEILSTTTQQKWSYDADSFATLTVADDSVTTLASGESGNIVIDAAGDIFLEADGGQIYMGDPGGDTKLKFDVQATTAYIDLLQNAPLIFRLGSGGASEIARFDQATDSFRLATDSPVQFRDTATQINSPSANVLTLTGPTVDVAGTFSLNSSNVTSTAPELNLLDASNTVPSVGSWGSVERIGVYDLVGGVAKPGSASGVSYTLGTLPSGSVVTNAYLDITRVFTPTNSSPAANIEIALGTTTTFSLAGAAILNEASITALASGGGGGPTFDANTTLGVLNLKDAGFGNGLATATTVKKLPTAENVILKVTDGAGGTEGLESTSHAKLYIKYVVM